MNNQVLSIKQMKELVNMGIDVSKASMCWFPKMALDSNRKPFVESHFLGINHIDHDSYWNTTEGKNTIPTFTLQDILDMFPFHTLKRQGIAVTLSVRLDLFEEHSIYETSEMQAAFEMLKFCKQNGYL